MPFSLPCREFPENAPEGVEEGCDGGPKAAWADGWNACLEEVKRRLDGLAAKDRRMTAEYNLLVQENRALLAQRASDAGNMLEPPGCPTPGACSCRSPST